MCIIDRTQSLHSLGKEALELGDVERAVEQLSEGIKSASEDDHHKRAAILAERSQAFLSLGDAPASRVDAEHAVLEDRFWAEGHFRRARAYEALGQLELAQEAGMQAFLLEPTRAEYAEKVTSLAQNIGRTDYGVGPHPADFEKERRHLLAEKLKAGRSGVEWTEEENPRGWYRRPAAEAAPFSLPLTALHALELGVHTHHIDARVLTKGRLTLHLAGATSEHEGASDFRVLFDKLPQLEELHVVQVGFLGVFGPCKTIVPDPQGPPQGQLVSQTHCLGNGRRIVVRKWLGMYHDFLEEASHHRFEDQGYLHEAPDLVMLANPGLDFFFDCWAPTVAALRDAGYLTAVTGGNLDQSRRHHNLILQALGVKITLRLRTSRFGLLNLPRRTALRQVKNHNIMAFKGAAPLPPGAAAAKGHPRTAEDFRAVRALLRRLGVELEAEPSGRARMERLRLQNNDSVRSTVSCCSDCGGGTVGGGGGLGREGRAQFVPLGELFSHGRILGGAGGNGQQSLALASHAGTASVGSSLDELSASSHHECTGEECCNGTSPRHALGGGEGGLSSAAVSTVGSTGSTSGWHCLSFRKTEDGGILMVDE